MKEDNLAERLLELLRTRVKGALCVTVHDCTYHHLVYYDQVNRFPLNSNRYAGICNAASLFNFYCDTLNKQVITCIVYVHNSYDVIIRVL